MYCAGSEFRRYVECILDGHHKRDCTVLHVRTRGKARRRQRGPENLLHRLVMYLGTDHLTSANMTLLMAASMDKPNHHLGLDIPHHSRLCTYVEE